MAETTYTYSISNDFTSLAVPSLNTYGLELKIIESQSITIQISGINAVIGEDEVYIMFQDSLTLQQKNDLDDIISSYTGLNESFNDAVVVKFEKQDLDKFYIQIWILTLKLMITYGLMYVFLVVLELHFTKQLGK